MPACRTWRICWYKLAELLILCVMKETLKQGTSLESSKVLYMSFDRFLLAVESCDLSQTDKILIIGSLVIIFF